MLLKKRRDSLRADAFRRVLPERVLEEPDPLLRDGALTSLHFAPPSSLVICVASWLARFGSIPWIALSRAALSLL